MKEALVKIKEEIVAKKVEVSNQRIVLDNSIPIETIIFEKNMLERVFRYLGIKLSYTQICEAMIVSKKSHPPDVVADAERLIVWLSQNMSKFRVIGSEGNHFSVKRYSHGPFGKKHATGLPSVANQTA